MGLAWKLCIFALPLALAVPQTKPPVDKSRPQSKVQPRAKKDTAPILGFAVAPMVLTDEGCARDYVRAFQYEGVEIRKRLTDLERYGCIDHTATGIFTAVSTERKDFAVLKDNVAYFRRVIIEFDPERTQVAVGRMYFNSPKKKLYEGWIPEDSFYAVSPQEFDKLLVEKKIPMKIE